MEDQFFSEIERILDPQFSMATNVHIYIYIYILNMTVLGHLPKQNGNAIHLTTKCHSYSKSTIKIPYIKTTINCVQPSWHASSSKMGGCVLESFGRKCVGEVQKILIFKLSGCCVMMWWIFSGEESEFWWKWKTAWLQLKKHLICYSNMLKRGQYALRS